MPIDINELREYKGGNPQQWKVYMQQRFKDGTLVDQVLQHDQAWRDVRNRIDALRKDLNAYQKSVITPLKKAKQPCDEQVAEGQRMQQHIKDQEALLPQLEAVRDQVLARIGNRVDPEVPIANDEEDNLVLKLSPIPPESITLPAPQRTLQYTLPPTKPLTHDVLLWRIGGYEPVRGQNVAGHRSYFLTNAGVLLNQAIINYAIAFLGERGYQVLQPPFFMNKDVMSSIAQLEDFDEQLYKVSGKTDEAEQDPECTTGSTSSSSNSSSEKYLIATSEQPICAYHKGEWLEPKDLPLRYAGISTCFRKEAGSSGKDIRGIFRVHQFEKIEQFCLTVDDFAVSQDEQQRMLQCATDFYDALGIGYRVVCLVSSELNDAAVKKYDLEGWFPGQQAYRELVSCSNCTDYQARGVGVRCGSKKTASSTEQRASYVHMLNATLCATGRGICCILENYQTPDGVIVPEVLRPYMGGRDFLKFVRDPPELTKGEKGKKK